MPHLPALVVRARSGRIFAPAVLFALGTMVGTSAMGTPAPPQAVVRDLLARARDSFHASQVILVIAHAEDAPAATLSTWKYADGKWRPVMHEIPAVIGKGGITLHKHEGDLKSPAGTFRMGRAFGSAPRPDGVRLPYTRTTRYDYWVDDPSSEDYNHWETYFGDARLRWGSFERLLVPDYKYAAVIQYNMDPVRNGLGSAIFFHVWEGPDTGTTGCTAVSERDVLAILRWLDPAEQPVIVQGTVAQLERLAIGGGAQPGAE